MGETGKSGRNPGSDAKAELAVILERSERDHGKVLGGVPESRTRLIMGDFHEREVSDKPSLRREVESLRPPLSPRFLAVWQVFWASQAIRGATSVQIAR